MTLLEYIQSLQDQNLYPEEIFAKAQEWKKNNPQPEVEEVKEDVEVKQDDSQTQDPSSESDEVTGSESEDGSSQQTDFKFPKFRSDKVGLSNKTGFGTDEYANKIFSDIRRKDFEKSKAAYEKYTSVAKPGETYVRPDSPDKTEYKYETEGNRSVYYYKSPESTDWKTHKKGSEAELAIASVFGHTDVDIDELEKRRKQREAYDKFTKTDQYRDFYNYIDRLQLDPETTSDSEKPLLQLNPDGSIKTPEQIEEEKRREIMTDHFLHVTGEKTLDLDKYINRKIKENNYDKVDTYAEYADKPSFPEDSDAANFYSEYGIDLAKYIDPIEKKIGSGNLSYDFDKLESTVDNFNTKDFLGFLKLKGYAQQYFRDINDKRRDKYGIYGTRRLSDEERKLQQLARERDLSKYLDLYLNQKTHEYNEQLRLSWIRNNPELVAKYGTLEQAEMAAQNHFRRTYGTSVIPLFDFDQIEAYKAEIFPQLELDKEKKQLLAKEKKQQRIEESNLGGVLNTVSDSWESAWDTVTGKLEEQAFSIGDAFGLLGMDAWKTVANEVDLIDRADDLSYVYARGTIGKSGEYTYVRDDDGIIYNTDLGIIETALSQDEIEKINKDLDENGEEGGDHNFRGSLEQSAGVAAGLLYDVAGMVGVGKFTRITKLGKFTNALKIKPQTFSQMSYYGFSGYASTKKDVYRQLVDAGITDKEAEELSNEAGVIGGIWYSATGLIAPNSKYIDTFQRRLGLNSIYKKALNSYKTGGSSAYTNSLMNSFKSKIPTAAGVLGAAKGGFQEVIQENIQELGMTIGLNSFVNFKAGSDILTTDYTFQDFWRTSLLSFGAGSAMVGTNTGGSTNPSSQLQNLFYVGSNYSEIKSRLNTDIINGNISQAEADTMLFDAKAVYNQVSKIPPNTDPALAIDSARIMQEISDLENKLKNTDSAFQDPIKKEISDKKLELDDLVAGRKGAEVVAEQLGDVGINRFDTTEDIVGAFETLKEQGITLEVATNDAGEILDAKDQGYGIIATLPNGTQQVIINNASSEADGVLPADKHEILHAFAARMDPAKLAQMGIDLKTKLDSDPNIKVNAETQSLLNEYEADLKAGKINEATFYEEVMAVTSDALTPDANGNTGITITESGKLKTFLNNFLEIIGWKQSFKDGDQVIDFLKGFNRDVMSGKGLSQQTLDAAGVTLDTQTEVDSDAVKTSKKKQQDVDNAAGPKDDAGNYTVTKAEWDAGKADQAIGDLFGNNTLQGLIESKIPPPSQQPPGFSKDDFVQATVTELIPHIRNFNPEVNNSLSGWINSQLSNKIGNVFKKGEAGTKDVFEADVTEARGVVAETETEVETQAPRRKRSPKRDAIYSSILAENLGTDVAPAIETAIQEDIKTTPVTNMAGTRNIGPALGRTLGKAFGINPKVFTDKRQNIQKKDLKGLVNLKQYLNNNAQQDFKNLPDAYDSSGKSTFIPNNILNALYVKDGKGKWKLDTSKTVADYKALLGDITSDKPIYRAAEAQTIKGLAALSFRNKIFETAFPKEELRVGTGVKFSKKPATIKQQQETIVEDFGAKVIRKGKEGVNRLSEFLTGGLVEGFGDATTLLLKPSTFAGAGNNIASALKRGFLAITDASRASKNKKDSIDGVKNGDILELKTIKEEVSKKTNTKNLDKDLKRDIQNAIGSQKGVAKALKNQGQQKSILNGKNFIFDGIRKIVLNNKFDIAGLQFMFGNQNANAGIARNMASINNDGRTNKKGKAYEEHWFPMGAWVTNTLKASGLSDKVWNGWKKFSNDNYYQEIVNKDLQENYLDKTYDVKMEDGSTVKWNSKSDLHPLLQKAIDKGLETGDFKDADKLADIRKYPGKDIHTAVNPFTHGRNGVSDAVRYEIIVSKADQKNPNIQHAVSSLINEIIVGKIDSKTAQERIDAYETTARDEVKSSKKNNKTFGDKVNPDSTIENQIKDLGNYDKAAELGRSLNTPTKGISVFDFDDTLAKTKEKVIVNMPNGETKSISASEFAQQASVLEEGGATFDFSNFEKVAAGTAKGPLADLALKRQDKFGSKDIFVLTARPQISASAIKTFLDGIGLNLPLANITGLADGTPGAKGRWVASKAAEGYNDFYFADDAVKNVKAVKEVLDQIDVKSDVQIAKQSKKKNFDKIFNDILESSTGIESFKEYSKAKAQTVGRKKGRFSFFTTPSAEDFLGLLYKTLGKGKVGDAQLDFYKKNLLDPYDRAELATTRAKVQAAADFKKLKGNLTTLPKSLNKEMGYGGFTHSQAARVAVWTRQGMTIPGLSKTDLKALNDFVDNNAEMNTLVDELMKIQKGKEYPAPGDNWLAGTITTDVLNGITKVNRKEYLQEWQENVDIIFSDKNMNKLEAAYGPKYVEALRDQLRRMKSGSNRPIGGSRVVNNVLDWLNNSVGAIMFLNTRSAVLQTLSAVNFIGVGNNGIINSAKAFANQKQYWKDFKTLMNSPYLVERRNGLKINVSESEIADAVAESQDKPKAALSYLLNKGFIFTRFADSFAIATGGAAFYRNQLNMYIEQGMPQDLAQKQAFEDFYAIAEKNQQSSNPSKISQQQASGAGRVILAFANTPMQYARIIKRSSQDLINGRGDWKKNVGTIAFYGIIQNVMFNALQNALFAEAFGEDEEEDKKKEDKAGRIANGMADSLLAGLGIQGKAALALKNSLITLAKEADKESPKFVKAVYDLFDFSPPLDSKFRKLRVAANTFTWDRKLMKEKGFSLDNPAYLAGAQVISGLTNLPLDRAIQKMNNIRGIMSEQSQNWQKVALALGWSTWDVGLGYYGGFDEPEPLTEQQQYDLDVSNMKKETTTKEQKQMLLDLGVSKQEIKKLRYEEDRVKKIIELQKKKK